MKKIKQIRENKKINFKAVFKRFKRLLKVFNINICLTPKSLLNRLKTVLKLILIKKVPFDSTPFKNYSEISAFMVPLLWIVSF